MNFLRVYEPRELAKSGYPHTWYDLDTSALVAWCREHGSLLANGLVGEKVGIKDLVRAEASHRCVRCGHPFRVGATGEFENHSPPDLVRETFMAIHFEQAVREQWPEIVEARPKTIRAHWSPCDEHCTHGGPARARVTSTRPWEARRIATADEIAFALSQGNEVQASWRILTVHHLNGRKFDCRWWNLAALCQVCHLVIQNKVQMERVYPFEHSDWFKPYAAGWYSYAYRGEELTRAEVDEQLDDLLALERVA